MCATCTVYFCPDAGHKAWSISGSVSGWIRDEVFLGVVGLGFLHLRREGFKFGHRHFFELGVRKGPSDNLMSLGNAASQLRTTERAVASA